MKIAFLLILAGIIGAIVYVRQPVTQTPDESQREVVRESVSSDARVSIADRSYAVYWQKISPISLSLIPNFREKKTSAQLMEENACTYGVNGGFYTSDAKPLGIFHAGEYDIRTKHTEPLFNGYVYKGNSDWFDITGVYSNFRATSMEFVFQSGPFFTPETKLRLKQDKQERRVFIGKTGREEFYFLTVTLADNIYGGPFLENLPEILEKLPLNIKEALNLDGGSASAFYSKSGVRLGELAPIGSFFCGK